MEERLDDAVPLDLKPLNINSVSEAKAKVWCEQTTVYCMRAITSLIYLLDGSGKVRVVGQLKKMFSNNERDMTFHRSPNIASIDPK